jgi:hypothetical protein
MEIKKQKQILILALVSSGIYTAAGATKYVETLDKKAIVDLNSTLTFAGKDSIGSGVATRSPEQTRIIV